MGKGDQSCLDEVGEVVVWVVASVEGCVSVLIVSFMVLGFSMGLP